MRLIKYINENSVSYKNSVDLIGSLQAINATVFKAQEQFN